MDGQVGLPYCRLGFCSLKFCPKQQTIMLNMADLQRSDLGVAFTTSLFTPALNQILISFLFQVIRILN